MAEIEINKGVQFGQPCIAGTDVRTEIVYERFLAGEPVKILAWDYGLTEAQIQSAINYEKVNDDTD